MHINDAFEIRDVGQAKSIIRAHPFATLVTADLRATHMPCLVDEDAVGLAIVGHVARADPVADSLCGPLLAIFHGPHGYVSASWYASETIPAGAWTRRIDEKYGHARGAAGAQDRVVIRLMPERLVAVASV